MKIIIQFLISIIVLTFMALTGCYEPGIDRTPTRWCQAGQYMTQEVVNGKPHLTCKDYVPPPARYGNGTKAPNLNQGVNQ